MKKIYKCGWCGRETEHPLEKVTVDSAGSVYTTKICRTCMKTVNTFNVVER